MFQALQLSSDVGEKRVGKEDGTKAVRRRVAF